MYSITLTRGGAPLEELEALLDPAELARDVSILLRKVAMVVLRNLILTCSVDTGRARGGFTALLEKYGVGYSDVVQRDPPIQTGRNVSMAARGTGLEEGRRLSEILIDQPFQIQIANAVSYVEFINAGVSAAGKGRNVAFTGTFFMDTALIRGAEYIDKVFDWYVDAKLQKVRATLDPRQGPGDIQS